MYNTASFIWGDKEEAAESNMEEADMHSHKMCHSFPYSKTMTIELQYTGCKRCNQQLISHVKKDIERNLALCPGVSL